MNVNLEYYKIFYHVAQCQSITGAAGELCISQPAVSQALKQLEQSLGAKLFMRTAKGVTLTNEGQTLFSYVKNGYEQIQLGEQKLQEMLDMKRGEIRIGASDMTLQFYLLPYLRKYHHLYPDIKVTVTNAPTPQTIEHLRAGRIDFGIVSQPFPEEAHLRILPVREIQDVFVAGAKFWNYKKQMLRYEELMKMPIICLESDTSTRTYVDTFLAENGVRLEPEFELATSDIIVQFVLQNLGIGCVVQDFAQRYIDTDELFVLQFDKQIPKRQICVVNDERLPLSVAAGKLMELLK
ncbi:MAG: LysR family transcriptional regulator [Lachnospiraceae bacterium]|nr:LysR family transcriptional regulator [Lachnospiraceae bacterium]